MEESEWINMMVVQNKKTCDIRMCVDLWKLNDACAHEPFPTPFTDDILENMGEQEAYSFIDVFLGNQQVRIDKVDHHKTTFGIDWHCF